MQKKLLKESNTTGELYIISWKYLRELHRHDLKAYIVQFYNGSSFNGSPLLWSTERKRNKNRVIPCVGISILVKTRLWTIDVMKQLFSAGWREDYRKDNWDLKNEKWLIHWWKSCKTPKRFEWKYYTTLDDVFSSSPNLCRSPFLANASQFQTIFEFTHHGSSQNASQVLMIRFSYVWKVLMQLATIRDKHSRIQKCNSKLCILIPEFNIVRY